MKAANFLARASLAALFAVWMLPGCGGAKTDPNRPETVSVSGTVVYQGQPVSGATVSFLSTSPASAASPSPGAVGRTDESGEFTLTTFAPGDGAIPGSYQVTVLKIEDSTAPAEVNPDPTAPPPPPPKSLLPEKFNNPNTSGLTADVTKEGENSFTFDLGS